VVKLCSLGATLVLLGSIATSSHAQERLSLDDAIQLALRQNPLIGSSQEGINAARGRFWRALSPPPPSFTAGYDYIPVESGISNYGERSLGISLSIEFPTSTVLRGSAASRETDAAVAGLSAISQSVVMRVKLAYFGLLAAQTKLALAHENLRVAIEFVQKAETRYNVGEGTNLELLTARVQRTQAESAVDVALNARRLSLGELHLALGNHPDRSDTLLSLIDTLSHSMPVRSLEYYMAQLSSSSPELRSMHSLRDAASSRRALAWSTLLPNFTLSYARQVQGVTTGLYGVSLGVSFPLWFMLDQRGQIQEATAECARLDWDIQARAAELAQETKSAYVSLANEERQVRLYDSTLVPQGEEVYRSAAASYAAGEITYVEYLQARQLLISVRDAHIDALYNFNAAYARLEKVVGTALTQ
jgi:outer membrane protein TolC